MSDEQGQEQQSTAAAIVARGEPNDREPTPERQAELRANYDVNVAGNKAPYADVAIRTRGEVAWICRERNWSVMTRLEPGQERPTLSGADLSDADLSGADLFMANLSGANLDTAILSGAQLGATDLSGALLRAADLSDALLVETDLSRSNLRIANLRGALLGEADLSSADLTGAKLSG